MQTVREEFLEDYGILEVKFPDSTAMPNTTDVHILPIEICKEISEKKSITQEEYVSLMTERIMKVDIDEDDMKELIESKEFLKSLPLKVFQSPKNMPL